MPNDVVSALKDDGNYQDVCDYYQSIVSACIPDQVNGFTLLGEKIPGKQKASVSSSSSLYDAGKTNIE